MFWKSAQPYNRLWWNCFCFIDDIVPASRAFVYTNAILLCKMLVGLCPNPICSASCRCRLRVCSKHFYNKKDSLGLFHNRRILGCRCLSRLHFFCAALFFCKEQFYNNYAPSPCKGHYPSRTTMSVPYPCRIFRLYSHSLFRRSCVGYPQLTLCVGKCGLSVCAFVSLP